MISLILCVDKNNLIGYHENNEFNMPWGKDNKEDLNFFQKKTTGNTIIMGYNTWKSLGEKPLPNRKNIVITQKHFNDISKIIDKNLLVFKTLEEALKFINKRKETFIIGGKSLYDAYWTKADRIYRTIIKKYKSQVTENSEKIYVNPIDTEKYQLSLTSETNKYIWEQWDLI